MKYLPCLIAMTLLAGCYRDVVVRDARNNVDYDGHYTINGRTYHIESAYRLRVSGSGTCTAAGDGRIVITDLDVIINSVVGDLAVAKSGEADFSPCGSETDVKSRLLAYQKVYGKSLCEFSGVNPFLVR